jgi:4-hydroxy-tetrahydrodipicolinate reductase
MNIALFGYGKMGKEIETIALAEGHRISAKVSSSTDLSAIDFSDTDVIIEFSRPESAVANITFALTNNIPIVVGTTGWYDHLDELTKLCQEKKGSLLYATNFSIGVNIFFAVNTYLAKIMNTQHAYTASIDEIHHTQKLDAPSGTGISLAEQLIENNTKYTHWENVKKSELSTTEALSITSQRIPNVPGTHSVYYASEIDEIELKHVAHNRKGFAKGSILAAAWLKDRKGIFTMKDVLNF